jgi:hypothetical protein
MLRFFRHIRQKLLPIAIGKEHQMSKYFLYALGEIFLVVIGILLALQINTWNEKRKNREQELVILDNILQDLKTDREGLLEMIDRRTSKAASADAMVGYYDGESMEKLSDYYIHWLNVLLWETHSPRNIAFQELVNAGNVSLIRNEDIRNSLLDINASYEELHDIRAHMYDDYSLYLYTPYSRIIDYAAGIKAWSDPDAPINLSREDVEEALRLKEIKNGFTLASFNNRLLGDDMKKIAEIVEKTIGLIETEIER